MSDPSPETKALLLEAAGSAERGELDAAVRSLKQLLAAEPDHEIGTGMLAGIYAQLGMHDRAIEQFDRLLQRYPENRLARLQMGMTQLQIGQAEAALETLLASTETAEDVAAQYFAGLALLELNRPEAARDMFDKAAANMPVDHPLYTDLQRHLQG